MAEIITEQPSLSKSLQLGRRKGGVPERLSLSWGILRTHCFCSQRNVLTSSVSTATASLLLFFSLWEFTICIHAFYNYPEATVTFLRV